MFNQRQGPWLRVICLTLLVALLAIACGQKPSESLSLDPSSVVQIVGNLDSALFVTDGGELWATGLNRSGELGISPEDGRLEKVTRMPDGETGTFPPYPVNNPGYLPAPVRIATNVKQAALGQAGAYLTNDGELWVMGQGSSLEYFPEVRHALANQSHNPTGNKVIRPLKVMDGVKKILNGGHFLILQENGDLYGMGDNSWGELGSAHMISDPLLIDQSVTDVFLGNGRTFYLKEDGQLYGCGRNVWGELGFGDPTLKEYYAHSHEDPPHSERMNFPPQLIATDVRSVYSSDYNSPQDYITLLLKTDGELHMLGKNFENVYGDGSEYHTTPQPIASNVRKMAMATLEGSNQVLLILTHEDQLLGWGSDLSSLGVENSGGQWVEIVSDVKDFWTTPNLFVLTNTGQMRATGEETVNFEEDDIGQLAGWSWE